MSGGNSRSKYYLSLGYLDQEGIGVGSELTRYSVRANVDSKVKSWLTIGLNSTLSVNNQDTPPGGGQGASPLTNALFMPNAVPLYQLDANGNKTYDSEGKVQYNWANPIFNDMNALALTQMDDYNTKTYRALVNPYVDFNIYGVHWKTSVSYDYSNLAETKWYNPYHGNGAACEGRLYKYNIYDITKTLTSTLNYAFSINREHNVSLMAGYEAYNNEYSYTLAHATGFSDDTMKELSMASTPYETKSKTDKERMVSWFGRVGYDYNDKYFASFSLRADGSSRFAPGHQWGTFWSAGLNWRINQEDFLKDVKWIDDLKLRASYGTAGSGTVNFAEGEFNMIRGSEMYLIIAELAADNNKEDEAIEALNAVKTARGLQPYSGSGDALKTEIQNERRRELFAEGHRWFDIKRRNLPLDRSNVAEDWSRVGTIPAGSDKLELPIPQDEIDANGALTESGQNPQYK